MKTKLLLSLFLVLTSVSVWAQVFQKIPHAKWTVTALNQYGSTSGNEGGVAFIKDELPATFYHSDYQNKYDGRESKKGQDGIQAFLIKMPRVYSDIAKITYAGRSDNNSTGWAKKVRIYLYETLPGDLPEDLSSLSYADKEEKLKRENNTILGTPAFENYNNAWDANDRTVKTAEFAELKSAQYVLFVMDEGHDNWLTCSDFHVYQKIEGIESGKPYYLKISDNKYIDTYTPVKDKNWEYTIGVSETPVATYFTLANGYWHISTAPQENFLAIDAWDVAPQQSVADNWTIEKVGDKWNLLQDQCYGDNNASKCRLKLQTIDGVEMIFCDAEQSNALQLSLEALPELKEAQLAAESVLAKTGVGYPADNSEARATLQAAIDAQDATVESINAAVTVYTQSFDEGSEVANVVLPEKGKVYRFVNASPSFFEKQGIKKALYSSNNGLHWQNIDASAISQLWTIQNISTADPRNITILNVGDANWPQSTGFTASVPMRNAENEGSWQYVGEGQFKIFANKAQGLCADNDGSGVSGNVINYNKGKNEDGAWYIQEVPVTKQILSAQIASIKNIAYSSLLKYPSNELKTAITTAEGVANTDDGDYASAFANLIAAVDAADLTQIDLGYFYLKSQVGQKYMFCNQTNLKTSDAKTPIKSVIRFTKAGNGTFYIQTDNGLYAQGVSGGTHVQLGTNKIAYTIERMSNEHYILRPVGSTGNRQYLHQDGSQNVVGWEFSSNSTSNTHWAFEALTEEELDKIYTLNISSASSTNSNMSVTYNGAGYNGNATIQAAGGFIMSENAPKPEDFTLPEVDDPMITAINISDNDIWVSIGYDGSQDVYVLRCVAGNAYARYRSDCQLSGSDATNMLTHEETCHPESFFFIDEGTGEYEGYFTIRPMVAPDKYVYNLETANDNSKVSTKAAPEGGVLTSGYYWKISSFGEDAGNITPYGGDSFGWNKRGSHNNMGHIGYWEGYNTANDNKWYVRTIDEEFIIPSYTEDDSKLGFASYASVAPCLHAKKIITTRNLVTLKNAAYEVVVPKPGTFFRMKNAVSGKYMVGNKDAMGLSDDTNINKSITSIFYIDENNELLSYNAGLYYDCYERGYASTIGYGPAGSFAKAYGGFIENTLGYKNSNNWVYGKGDTNYGNLDRGQGNDVPGEGYNWIFEPVIDLPVIIGTTGYATFYSPVAVTLPNDGLKAYYVSEAANTSATMTEIASVIPANTGVILQGTEDTTYELIITDENSNNAVESKLSGTVAATYVQDDAYILAKPQDKEVGLYKVTLDKDANGETGDTHFLNNAFKAYLPASAVTAAGARLLFDFGTETAIESIEGAENADAVVYDLAGRRVKGAQKGLYIVNGKVVVK